MSRTAEAIGKYPLLFLFVLFLSWIALYLFLPIDYRRDVLAPQGEGDRLYFGSTTIISQEFNPHRGLSGIEIPLGSAIQPNGSLLLHIRPTLQGEDLVVAPLFSFQEQSASFHFSPLWAVPEKLLWIIEAPHAPQKSFWTYREQDSSAFSEGKIYQNARLLRGNVAFSEIWKYPRIASLNISAPSSDFADFEYDSLIAGAVALFLFLILRRFHVPEQYIVFTCILLGALLHIWLGLTTPVIIDEGAYVQDVLQVSPDLVPFRDFLTKGPAYLFLLWLWSFVVPHTVIGWRLFSIGTWALGGFVLWKLAGEWNISQRGRLLAVGAFSLMPAAVALTTPLLLQTASASTTLLGFFLALRAIKNTSIQFVAYSALVFTLAFFIRITAVIPACIALAMYLLYASRGWKLRFAGIYVGTGLLAFGILFSGAVALMGVEKAAIVTNMEAFLISQNRQELIQKTATEREPIIRTATIESRLLWRTGALLLAPLIILPLIFVYRQRLTLSTGIILLVCFVGWGVFHTLADTNFLLPKMFISTVWLTCFLFFGVPFITGIAALLYSTRKLSTVHGYHWQTLILIAIWLIFTALAYSQWGRFRQSYLTEFIPQLALLFGIGFDFVFDIWSRIKPKWLASVFISTLIFFAGMSVYQGYAIAERYPHTGTIDQKSLLKITRVLEKNVPKEEMIFTAQPVATAFSHRKIMFGYSHPGWYREARFGTISEDLRNLLFRTPEAITEYLQKEANFVLMDTRTNEIYFDGYPERTEILKDSFIAIGSITNEMAGDTYTLYRRR